MLGQRILFLCGNIGHVSSDILAGTGKECGVSKHEYCIGCQHLYFDPGSPDDCRGSTLTGNYGGTPAEMSCQKGHWRELMMLDILDIEEAMKKAATCKDYQERET